MSYCIMSSYTELVAQSYGASLPGMRRVERHRFEHRPLTDSAAAPFTCNCISVIRSLLLFDFSAVGSWKRTEEIEIKSDQNRLTLSPTLQHSRSQMLEEETDEWYPWVT